mmetsp:Transcript_64838/g.141276  ORF Transcript_64838/g.141276 Transcript_64838/m.141276 type:complete len:218 (-) Transcript_64838:1139-1792(-)
MTAISCEAWNRWELSPEALLRFFLPVPEDTAGVGAVAAKSSGCNERSTIFRSTSMSSTQHLTGSPFRSRVPSGMFSFSTKAVSPSCSGSSSNAPYFSTEVTLASTTVPGSNEIQRVPLASGRAISFACSLKKRRTASASLCSTAESAGLAEVDRRSMVKRCFSASMLVTKARTVCPGESSELGFSTKCSEIRCLGTMPATFHLPRLTMAPKSCTCLT